MQNATAHELADSWELRAGLLDADPADASISACLRECAAELRSAACCASEHIEVPIELLKDAHESVDDYASQLEFGAHDRKLLGRLKAALSATPAPAMAPLSEDLLTEHAARKGYARGTAGSAMFRKGARFAESQHGIGSAAQGGEGS